MAFIDGIDVSRFQGDIDWPRVKAAGERFAFIKATDGASLVDPSWQANAAQAAQSGVPFGAYHRARPDSSPADATDEARHFLSQLTGTETLLPVVDLESGEGLGRSRLTDWALEWLGIVGHAVGRPPIIYVGFFFTESNLDQDQVRLADHPLWLPWYRRETEPPAPRPWTTWHIWQYTDDGRVDGIAGPVDRDHARAELFDDLLGTIEPKPPPVPREDEDMAKPWMFRGWHPDPDNAWNRVVFEFGSEIRQVGAGADLTTATAVQGYDLWTEAPQIGYDHIIRWLRDFTSVWNGNEYPPTVLPPGLPPT